MNKLKFNIGDNVYHRETLKQVRVMGYVVNENGVGCDILTNDGSRFLTTEDKLCASYEECVKVYTARLRSLIVKAQKLVDEMEAAIIEP